MSRCIVKNRVQERPDLFQVSANQDHDRAEPNQNFLGPDHVAESETRDDRKVLNEDQKGRDEQKGQDDRKVLNEDQKGRDEQKNLNEDLPQDIEDRFPDEREEPLSQEQINRLLDMPMGDEILPKIDQPEKIIVLED